jgi:hypothetical protein
MRAEAVYDESRFQLATNNWLTFVSDGVIEAVIEATGLTGEL